MQPPPAVRTVGIPVAVGIKRLLFTFVLRGWCVGLMMSGPVVLADEPSVPAAAATNSAPPAAEELCFTHLTVADGLSDSTMTGAVQDRQGYMWFSTGWGGLNRYDGYEFKVYQHDDKDARSLSQNNVTVLYLDHSGVLWAGTESAGLNRYDPATDDFTRFRSKPGDETSLAIGRVGALREDTTGALWVGTGSGLSRLDRATGKFTTFRHDPKNPHSLSDNAIDSLFCDPDTGELWVGTMSAGIAVLAKGAADFTFYRPDKNAPGSLSGGRVISFCKDRSGTLWVGTDAGLNRFVPESGTFVHYRNNPNDTNSLNDDFPWDLHEDRRGRFWIATPKGVDLMDRGHGTFTHLPTGSDDAQHLFSPIVRNICEDNTGALWFTDVEQGVNRLSSEPPLFTAYRKQTEQSEGLGHEFVLSLYADSHDRVWIGTMGGLDFLEKGRPPVRHIRFPENLAPMLHTVAEDGEGGYWAGAFPQGMFHIRGDEVTRLLPNRADPTRPASDQIWAFAPDPRHGLWILYWMIGMDYFDGHKFVRYGVDPGNPERLHEGIFIGCATDDQGNIWLAGPPGLARLDPLTGVFTMFQIDPEHPEDELNHSIACVFADRKSPGEIWVGSSSGLFQFDKASGKFTQHYGRRDGLCSDGVQAIQRDDLGRLWLGTLSGLSRFDPVRGGFRNYDLGDGLPGKKFFNGAAARTSDGRLFFGTTKGLVMFDPARMPENPHPPPVVLTGFELFNKPVSIGGEQSPLRKAINVADEITLTHRQSVFTFKFAALNFTAPEDNVYAYRMEGFDDDWRYTDAKRRFATYTRLAPGHYTFRVKASNNDGVWNEQGASIRINILPPWWQTGWFITAAAVAALALAYFGHGLRVRSIKNRNLTLQREVAARTAELTAKSTALETANKELESFSSAVSHDLRGPLRSIDGFSRILIEDYADKLDDEGRANLGSVRAASGRMGQLIDDLLRLSKVSRGEMRLSEVDLSQFAEEAAAELKKFEPERKVQFAITPNCIVRGDASLLRIVMENLLGNAWKYTGKKAQATIEFGATVEGSNRVYFVRDDGCGFDMRYVGKLFGAFQRLHNGMEFPGTGVGLATVQRIIGRHGGRIWAEGCVGVGATFYFTLPRPDHEAYSGSVAKRENLAARGGGGMQKIESGESSNPFKK